MPWKSALLRVQVSCTIEIYHLIVNKCYTFWKWNIECFLSMQYSKWKKKRKNTKNKKENWIQLHGFKCIIIDLFAFFISIPLYHFISFFFHYLLVYFMDLHATVIAVIYRRFFFFSWIDCNPIYLKIQKACRQTLKIFFSNKKNTQNHFQWMSNTNKAKNAQTEK